MFKCKICEKEFESKQKLGGHVSGAHYRTKEAISKWRESLKKSGKKVGGSKTQSKNIKKQKCSCIKCKKEVTVAGINMHYYRSHTKAGQELSIKLSKVNRSKTWKNQYTIAKELGLPKPEFSKETREKLSKLAIEKNKTMWTPVRRAEQSRKRKKFLKEHPEMHPSVLCANNKVNMSYPEQIFELILTRNGYEENKDYTKQHNIETYYVDFYFPKLDLGVEIDGEHWHDRSDPKEIKREEIIKEHIDLVRFWAKDITNKSKEKEILEIILRV